MLLPLHLVVDWPVFTIYNNDIRLSAFPLIRMATSNFNDYLLKFTDIRKGNLIYFGGTVKRNGIF